MNKMIPLSKLKLSDNNVRKTNGEAGIDQLADDIAARGLLQNLIATASKKRGFHDVLAGGRRYRAMARLVERGTWAADREIACLVLSGENEALSEASLAENFQRLAMTPADECRAFQHFIGQDGDVDGVAKRFGLTRRFVEGRLRLAALAEPIFDALSAGELTLDLAKAYACTDNHEKQLRAFKTYGVGGSYFHGNVADSVRRAITSETMKGNDPIALLVGEDAYLAAGGKIDRDLFSENGNSWTDPEIAQLLVAERMEAEASRIAGELGIAWIRPVASTDLWQHHRDLFRVNIPAGALDEAQTARLEEIETAIDSLQTQIDDENTPEEQYEEMEKAFLLLDNERDEINDRPGVLPEEWKQEVGLFLKLSQKGEMILDGTYYSERPLRMQHDEEGNVTGGEFVDKVSPSGSSREAAPPRPEAEAPGGKAISARLFDELAIQRRDILSASMLGDPGLALDLAIFAIADTEMLSNLGTTIRAGRNEDPNVGEPPITKAREAIAEAREKLNHDWCEAKSDVVRFDMFRMLDDDEKAAWLAYAVATSLQAKPTYELKQNPLQNRLGAILEIDVATWWRPTAENFFGRVPKGAQLALLHEVGGPSLSSRYAASKKSEIAVSCENLFAGEAHVEPEVKERALQWVPNAMRFLDGDTPEPDILDGHADREELAKAIRLSGGATAGGDDDDDDGDQFETDPDVDTAQDDDGDHHDADHDDDQLVDQDTSVAA